MEYLPAAGAPPFDGRSLTYVRGSACERGLRLYTGITPMMICCPQFEQLIDSDLARHAQPYQLTNGTIITEIDTEYFLVFGEERHKFAGLNYCPFCGKILSRQLWNLEKKK